MGHFLYSKINKKEIILDKYIEDSTTYKTIEVPSSLDGFIVSKINSNCFYDLKNDGEQIVFPDKKINILDFAIDSCQNLKKVFLGKYNKFRTFISDKNFITIVCNNENQYKSLNKLYKNSLKIFPLLPYSFEYVSTGGGYFISKFNQSSSDTEITIPDFYNGKKVLGLFPFVFAKKNITSVTFNKFIDFIPDNCFSDCYNLELLNNISNIKNIGLHAFSYTKILNINFLDMPKLVSIGEGAFCKSGIETFCPVNSNLVLSPRAFVFSNLSFSDMSLMDSENIPDGLFYGCLNLEKVILPIGTLKIGQESFKCCNKLTEILNIEELQELGAFSFFGCRKLKLSLNFSKLKKIYNGAVNGVKLNEELEIPLRILDSGSLYGVIGIKKIKVIGNGSIPVRCFLSASIQEIELDENIKKIENEAFLGSSVKKINLENITKLGDRCFAYSLIQKAVFRDLKKIEGGETFWNCTNLRKISIKKASLKNFTIDNYAGCLKLSDNFD